MGSALANDEDTEAKRGSIRAPVCVTRWSALARALQDRFGPLQVADALADLVIHAGHEVVIVDTKVRDLDVWPAPLLLNPNAIEQTWLFLVSGAKDTANLWPLPPRSVFFDRKLGSVDDLVEFITKETNPQAPRRIASVRFLRRAGVFIVRMDSGQSVAPRLRDLAGADNSDVVRSTISRDRSYFRVRQASGNTFEVPWDVVLHHSDPKYQYNKSRTKGSEDEGPAQRIGDRVRQLRNERGWSVAYLAERSGMKRPNLSRLETGRHLPSLETLERVADALQVPVAQLVAR